MWIQQTAAEQRLRYHKVLGKENPADLYTKFLDAATNNLHTSKLGYRFIEGRSVQAPQLHMVSQSIDEYYHGDSWRQCEWVQTVIDYVSTTENGRDSRARGGGLNSIYCSSKGSRTRKKVREDIDLCEVDTQRGKSDVFEPSTECQRQQRHRGENESGNQDDLGQLVLRGSKRQVQGSNGSNPAQPCRPLGSTQTPLLRHNRVKFPCQSSHAVIKAWGVAHTLGVDSREDRIRLPSEKGRTTEQTVNMAQTTWCKNFENEDLGNINVIEHDEHTQQHNRVSTTQGLSCNWAIKETCTWCYNNKVSPARRQSGELYSIHRVRRMQKLAEPLRGTEQLGVAANDRGKRLLQEQQLLNLSLKGNDHDCYYYYTTNNHNQNVIESRQPDFARFRQNPVMQKVKDQYYCEDPEMIKVIQALLQNILERPMAYKHQEEAWSNNSKCTACQVGRNGESPHDTTTIYNTQHKNGMMWRSLKESREWGAQCAAAQTTTTNDNSERRMELGRYQPCALASTTNLGVVVEGGCKGYQLYCIVIICFKHTHRYVVLCSEPKHNVWLKNY